MLYTARGIIMQRPAKSFGLTTPVFYNKNLDLYLIENNNI